MTALRAWLVTAWRLLRAGATKLWDMLWAAETPLVVTVLLAVAAALLSPLVTEKYERQRMQAQYVLANLRDLNGLISEVYVHVTAINYAVAAGGEAPKESVTKAREALARLNWKTIETAAMLPKGQRRVLHQFQTDARAVSQSLDGPLDIQGCQRLVANVNAMALSAALSIQTVGRHADLGSGAGANESAERQPPGSPVAEQPA